jgi:hypothetical protein
MLPSVRLIVASFLFGFAVVFAALHVAAVTRIAHDTLPGLATPAVAAPVILAHVAPAVQAMPPAQPAAAVTEADPPRIDLTVPVLFDLNSLIRAIATAPEAIQPAPDTTPVSAEFALLTLLPEITARPVAEATPIHAQLARLSILPGIEPAPEVTPVPAQLAKLTILPGIEPGPEATPKPAQFAKLTILPEVAWQAVSEPRVVSADRTVAAGAPAPLTLLPEMAWQSVKVAAAAPSEPTSTPAKPAPMPDVTATEPVMKETVIAMAPATEITGLIDTGAAAASPAANEALNQFPEVKPITVMIRLPVAKPPLPAKTQAAPKNRPTAARPAAPPNPFAFPLGPTMTHDPFARPTRKGQARDPFDFLGKRQF